MRWGIFSDIHGNLEALQAVLAALAKERIDRYLCLGDIVGYGANPSECIAEIKKLKPQTIVGNHDRAVADMLETAYFNPHAQAAVLWTARNITNGDKRFLKNLELTYQQDELTLVHGSLYRPEQFEYILDIHSAKKTFGLLRTRFCFIGHSHAPIVFIRDEKIGIFTSVADIKLQDAQSYIVNAGSVGQPRDGNPQASFVVYDSQKNKLQIKRVSYDVQKAKDKIIKAGLPRILAERLVVGR